MRANKRTRKRNSSRNPSGVVNPAGTKILKKIAKHSLGMRSNTSGITSWDIRHVVAVNPYATWF